MPVRITTLTDESFSRTSNVCCNYSINGLDKKISLVGGSMWTTAIESLIVTLTIEGVKWALIALSLVSTIIINSAVDIAKAQICRHHGLNALVLLLVPVFLLEFHV